MVWLTHFYEHACMLFHTPLCMYIWTCAILEHTHALYVCVCIKVSYLYMCTSSCTHISVCVLLVVHQKNTHPCRYQCMCASSCAPKEHHPCRYQCMCASSCTPKEHPPLHVHCASCCTPKEHPPLHVHCASSYAPKEHPPLHVHCASSYAPK